MISYRLIWSEDQISQFYDLLPKLDKHESHMVSLFARHKYISATTNLKLNVKDSTIERKFIDEDNKAHYINLLRRYEVPVGSFTDRNGTGLPDHVLALYASVNPRGGRLACRELAKELIAGLNGELSNFKFSTLQSKASSYIQKTVTRKLIFDIDIDEKNVVLYNKIMTTLEDLELDVCRVASIETRGGFHILMDIAAMHLTDKQWYPKLHKAFIDLPVELKTDTLCPIPGTIQGGFNVRFFDE